MTEKHTTLQLIYTFFLSVLLALFVGVGINAFYPPPAAPVFPAELNTYGKEQNLSTSEIAAQKDWEIKNQQYQKVMKPYNRNVSMIAVGAATVLLVLSLVFENKIKFVADGVMMGGLLTLFYSVGRGFASDNSKYQFTLISIALIGVLYMGYHRFARFHEEPIK